MTKRPTLADVAARAGVSVALVSIAMRGAKGVSAATSEQIFKAAQEIGYRPDARARLLRRRRSPQLGVQLGLPYRSTPTWWKPCTRWPSRPGTSSR